MTKKKQTEELDNLAVVEFPSIHIVPTKNNARSNQELYLIQIDDGYRPRSIFVNRSWNKDIKFKS